jgi:multiple sugar transport system substrate-binding protein
MILTSHQKKILLVASLIVISVIFFGIKFHRTIQTPVDLEIWGILDNSETFLPIINNFQKQYPYINIKYSLKDKNTYHTDLLKAFSDNQSPDIFMVWNSNIPYYKNKISSLDFKKDKDLNLLDLEQTYPQIAKNELLKDDYLLGIPLYADNLALYYNKDILNYYNIALPPSTWEEVLSLISRLRRTNNQGQITRAAIALGSPYNVQWNLDIVSALMMQYGSNIVDIDQKQTTFKYDAWINDKKIIPGEEALKFYTQFSDPRSSYYTWNDNFTDSVIAFSKGETAMLIGYNQAQKIIKEYNPNLNYGIASLPQFDNNSSNKINYGDVMSLVVSQNSKYSKECWQFLKFLAQKNVSEFYYSQTKNPPVRLDLIQKYINEPTNGIFIRQILTSQNWYQYNFQEITKIFQEMIEDVTNKGKTSIQAIITATDRIDFFWNKAQ